MAKLSDSNTLELRIAFHNAVARFQDWTADVAEPRVKLCGKFCPISEVCEEVASLSDPLPESILSILYKNTHAGDDALALKIDETYRGAGQHLLRLIAKRKDEIGGGKHCDRNHASLPCRARSLSGSAVRNRTSAERAEDGNATIACVPRATRGRSRGSKI